MNRLIVVLALFFWTTALAVAQIPAVIAWQAPPGPDGYNYNSATYNSPGCAPVGMAAITQFACFIKTVLTNISGIGMVVPWGVIDNCSALGTTSDQPCFPDSTCDPVIAKNCYNWTWIDQAIGDYVLANNIGSSGSLSFSNGCAEGNPCKIVLIVWLTQDSGNLNTYAGTPNTPFYVFTKAYANSLNSGAGCGAMCSQDVMVCKERRGGTGGGWAGGPQITDSAWASGGGVGDFGLWNAYGPHILANPSGQMTTHAISNNFSGYPVMYEQPIRTAAESFLSALALHYSSTCVFSSCTTGTGTKMISSATIAPYIAYMRIGPSGGGENYPFCACASSTGGSQCDRPYWPGPKGYDGGEPLGYSDQGYLTAWSSASGDGAGYVASLYQYIHSLSWVFPIDTPTEKGPATNMSIVYPDTEALLANQYGLGMGMQASSVGDLVTYAAQSSSPSTAANWAVHFREFPYVPVHHLQTAGPGSPPGAQFTITQIATAGCIGQTCSTATITCSLDCSSLCLSLPWVYITGIPYAAFDGIQPVSEVACSPYNIVLTGSYPAYNPQPGNIGFVYSGAHLPVLLPFESQQCQGSLQTICSAELWEELLDWAYGTNTVSNTVGNTGSGDISYQNAISNFLAGLPSATSFHSHMSTSNANHY